VERFGLVSYNCEDAFERYAQQVTAVSHPTFHKITNMAWDDIWMRPVATQVAEEIEIYREEFSMILADLGQLPQDKPILAEGAALMPELVVPLLASPNQAAWMVPTEPFQRETYAKRTWIHDILQTCRNPDVAFRNWMDRDVAFAKWVAAETAVSHLTLFTTDGTCTIDETAVLLAQHFGLLTS
ncbi:MAG: hypothetical protein DWQ04_09055, partial [Chloroflexi bacterium]